MADWPEKSKKKSRERKEIEIMKRWKEEMKESTFT